MALKRKLISLGAATALAALCAAPSLANVQIWNFTRSSQHVSNNDFGNSLNLTSSDAVTLRVTGGSDTKDVTGPDTVQDGKLIWANSNGLGIQNRDEDTGSPNHSVDSVTSDSDGAFDMVLLEFGATVNLTSLKLNWATGGSSNDKTDISILVRDGIESPGLSGKTWVNVLDSNGGNYGAVGDYSNVGLSYYTVNPESIESTKWLISVYNPVFGAGGSPGNDDFKLIR